MQAVPLEFSTTADGTPSMKILNQDCYSDSFDGQFPFSSNPTIFLHILTSYGLDSQHLASLEVNMLHFYMFTSILVCYIFNKKLFEIGFEKITVYIEVSVNKLYFAFFVGVFFRLLCYSGIDYEELGKPSPKDETFYQNM